MTQDHHDRSHPLSLDTELIDRLRADLQASEWTVALVEMLLSPSSRAALDRDQVLPAQLHLRHHTSAAATFTRLFVLGAEVDRIHILTAFPQLGEEGAVELGLIEPLEGGTKYRARVDLRPHTAEIGQAEHHWWVASDLSEAQTGHGPKPDHVLGIAGASTTLAMQTMRDEVDRALDLGCGSGILALYLSTHAREVVATDISARACNFTRFNSALNQAGIDVREGSFFEPVEDETFDLIASNPPFVITPESTRKQARLEYRDAGMEGDAVLPLILSQAVAHLRDGGSVQILANWGVDRHLNRWQVRPTKWVEDATADLVEGGGVAQAWIVRRDLVDAAQYAHWWMLDEHGQRPDPKIWQEDYREWLRHFSRVGATYIGLGSIAIRVHHRGGPELVVVAEDLSEALPLDGTAVRTALDHLTLPADWEDTHFLRAPDVREVRYYVPGSPDPELVRLVQGRPGGRERDVSSAVAALVGVCGGELTPAQVIPAIATLLGEEEGEVRRQVEEALPTLLLSGALEEVEPA